MSIKFQRLELFSSDIRLQESRNTRHPPSIPPPESASCVQSTVWRQAAAASPAALTWPLHCYQATSAGARQGAGSRDVSGYQESQDFNSRSYYSIIYFIFYLLFYINSKNME